MWWIIVPVGVVLALVAVWFFYSGRLSRRVFADEHFQEVAAKLPALKRAALEQPVLTEADLPRPPNDPRALLTDVGLAVVYTISPEGDAYSHHLSVSLPARGYTAHAVGDMFMWFLARLLGIEMNRLRLGISPTTVHHAE